MEVKAIETVTNKTKIVAKYSYDNIQQSNKTEENASVIVTVPKLGGKKLNEIVDKGNNFITELNNVENLMKLNVSVDDLNNLKRPVLAFKFQKNSPKLKTFLHGSVKQAFSDSEEELSNKKCVMKDRVPTTLQLKSSKEDSTFENYAGKDSKLCYREPLWSGVPEDIYKIDILKGGVILTSLLLSNKNYYVIGYSLSCDITLTHESISQFHAVLQNRKISNSENKNGMYIYDLNSAQGTFLNGNRIEPNTYIPLYSGYILSFGNSQRKYIIQTSKENEEKEAELSPVELKELKRLESQEQERLDEEKLLKEKEERIKKEDELKGISWGIAEDTDGNSRLTESSGNLESDNEELFLNDPTKALKDWFEWEGHDLEYQTEDIGFGRFSCSIKYV